MYCADELGLQTRTDGFGILYGKIAGALIERCGRKGKGIVRRVLAAYGEEKGRTLRRQYREDGVRTDLHSLVGAEKGCWNDPRTLIKTIRDTPEAQLWEVYSCPLEKIWRELGAEEAGRLYCEEYLHALMVGYSEGAGQANVSNHKTCLRDDRCVMAMYCRVSNMNEAQRAEFRAGEKEGKGLSAEENMLLLYRCLMEIIKEEKDTEAAAAIAHGIKCAAEIIAERLTKEAACTGRKLDEEFLAEFFPFCQLEELREDRILRQCFLEVFKESLRKGVPEWSIR